MKPAAWASCRRFMAALLVVLSLQGGTPHALALPESAAAPSTNRNWWAFQPVRRPAPPSVSGRSQPTSPIDAFIRAKLDRKGLRPNPPASRRSLIRRAYFDLIGLPPSPEEVAAFENDRSPDAWPRLIDRLLALPQYGERWGRHWLDIARYAQSNGYERDGEKPLAWRYRDYVVHAFNEDKPYDQFIKEQLAGDELLPVTTNGIVATGFQRLGVWDDEPDDKRMAEFDELDDVLSTTGAAFLGLTIGCARCHEHKFDPFPQAEYYQLLGYFRNMRLSEGVRYTLDSGNYVPLAEPARVQEWQAGQKTQLAPLETQLAATTNAAERKALTQQISAVKNAPPPFEWALAVRERGTNPPPTHVLGRGDASRPGAQVQPGFPAALSGHRAPAASAAATSGRRLALAEWIASPENPLTARVLVNRLWHHHFGRGIVTTTSDFGHAGTPPSHPEVIDWLAAEFVERGWSIKQLHRTILASETYQQSCSTDNSRAAAVDPGNELVWRQNLRRLDAEALRDSLLAISGRLNPKMGGRGFFPHLSGEVLAGQSRPGLDWEISSPEERSRRSLYAYVRRTMPVPMLDALDYSNTTSPLGERPVTTVSSQALLLLNDEFMQDQAAALAERLVRDVGSEARMDALIERGFLVATGRRPTRVERTTARRFVRRQEKEFGALRGRLLFRPDVPTSLSVTYMDKMTPGLFLRGPVGGWDYFEGRWSAAYEGIRTVEKDRGPFALVSAPEYSNGVVAATLILHHGCESAGLLFCASPGDRNQLVSGYEVTLAPREQRLILRRHAADVTDLATVAIPLAAGRRTTLKVETHGARLRVWADPQAAPLLDVIDDRASASRGRIGFRAWGAAMSVESLVVQPEGAPAVPIVESPQVAPARRALESFALLLLNLNEVAYAD